MDALFPILAMLPFAFLVGCGVAFIALPDESPLRQKIISSYTRILGPGIAEKESHKKEPVRDWMPPPPPTPEQITFYERQKAKRAELEREAQQIRELRSRADHRRRNTCYVEVQAETGVQLLVNWPEQLQAVWVAWDDSDWDFVRTWLQKYAYEITSNGASEAVHSDFKKLMIQFTQVDPLYKDVMAMALPQIQESPGILQSSITKLLQGQFKVDDIRYALYFAAESGQISRVKKGRSYQLHSIAE